MIVNKSVLVRCTFLSKTYTKLYSKIKLTREKVLNMGKNNEFKINPQNSKIEIKFLLYAIIILPHNSSNFQ